MTTCAELADLPEAFAMQCEGPSGVYEMSFVPSGRPGFAVRGVADEELFWWIDRSDQVAGAWELSGLTHDTKPIWGDVYWFIVHTGGERRVEYWGDRVIIRTDRAL